MDFADVTLAGREGDPRQPRRRGVDRRRGRRVRRARCTRCSRARVSPTARPSIEKINFIGHRYLIDLLAGTRPARPRRGDRLHLVGGRPRVGGEPPAAEGVPRHRRLRRRGAVGAGARQGRLHVEQAGDLRLRRARGDAVPEAGDPHQRDLPRPDRHAARAGEQGHVARVRRRLPRRGRASRPRPRSSRRTRSSSCAATRPARSPARR